MAKPQADARLNADAVELWLAADDGQEAAPDLDGFIDAASVLSSFDPEKLRAVDGRMPDTRVAIALVDHSARLAGDNERQLRDAPRQSAAGRLGNRKSLKRARAANPGVDNPLQRGIDLLIASNSPPDLSGRTLSDLLGLQQAVRWLAGISDLKAPDPQFLTECIERERVLQPMRRLLANGFVGREAELSQLRSYVDVLSSKRMSEFLNRLFRHVRYLIEERPPLFLFGPGGVGKSTLLAKFILDHANPSDAYPMPFIYLDFDRASLDPQHTRTLMTEALAQIRAQFPDLIDREHLDETRELAANTEFRQISKGAQFGRAERLIERLADLLDQLAARNGQPVLFVLDTFEEAQSQGDSAVLNVWNLLGELMRRVDRVRVVVAGRRALSKSYPHEPVEISSLDESTAVQFLEIKTRDLENGPLKREDTRAVFNLIKITGENGRQGAVPLSLALAARIVLREGLAALKSTVQRRRLFASITAEQQLGMLNTRVLQHLQGTDPDLKKLIDPGLVLRRITPAVIREVLASPCEIVVVDDNRARDLFEALTKEIGLVDADREPGAVWHLPTARRAMLPLLIRTLGDAKLRAIHDSAVEYYDAEGGTVARAEALFHRLSRGDPTYLLDEKWNPELAPLLRSAYDELDGQPKLWLAGKLGLEVDEALRIRAHLRDWEQQAEIRARSLLSSGLAIEALAALRERSERIEASQLPALEADALLLLGRPTEARDVVLRALQRGESAAKASVAAALFMRLATIDERDGRVEDALQAAEDAISSSRLINDSLTEVGAWSSVLRLRQKLGLATSNSETQELIDKASRSDMRSALRQNPAVLRELAAALGPTSPGIVADALEVLGMDRETLVPVAVRLHDLVRMSQGSERLVESLTRLVRRETGVNTAGLGREFANLLRGNVHSPEFVRILSGTLAANVQTSVDQVIRSHPSGVTLTSHQQKELCAALSINLKPYDFELLVYAALDVDTRTLSRSVGSYESHVEQVVESLDQSKRLTPFLESILRSSVVGPALRSVATRLLAQRGGLDHSDLAIDLNDLNGLQKRELGDIITQAFDQRELEMLLAKSVNLRLSMLVAANAPFRQVAFDVISASQAQGWTDQLVAAMQVERPNNPLVSGLVSRLTLLGVDGDRNLAGRSLERTVAEQGGFQDLSHWTSALTIISGQVCLIEGLTAIGSGFLVGPDLILTAYSVVEYLLKAGEAKEGNGKQPSPFACRFDYVREMDRTHQGIVVTPASSWLVHHSRYSTSDIQRGEGLPAEQELDYALIRLSTAVGNQPGRSGNGQRGWIDAGRRTKTTQPGDTLFILQHPEGQPLRLSAGRVLGSNANDTRMRYDAETIAGSSGSPCFDAAFNLVAMHHGGVKTGPQRYNVGIPIGLIVKHLHRAGIELSSPEADTSVATA